MGAVCATLAQPVLRLLRCGCSGRTIGSRSLSPTLARRIGGIGCHFVWLPLQDPLPPAADKGRYANLGAFARLRLHLTPEPRRRIRVVSTPHPYCSKETQLVSGEPAGPIAECHMPRGGRSLRKKNPVDRNAGTAPGHLAPDAGRKRIPGTVWDSLTVTLPSGTPLRFSHRRPGTSCPV